MIDIPTKEPREIIAGDTVQWRREDLVDDFPASAGWGLKYALRLVKGDQEIDITASADGDAFAVNLTASATANYNAGRYEWAAYVSKAPERFRVDRGILTIRENLEAITTTRDARTHARKVLEAIEAVIEGRASKDQQAYQIGDRRLDRTPIADLLVLRDKYKAEVAREDAAEDLRRGDGSGRMVLTRFH